MIRLIFFGTESFAAAQLDALLHDARFEIVEVVTQPARPVGRKQISTKSPVHLLAENKQVPVFTPTSLKNDEAFSHLSAVPADLFVVAQYGLIVPDAILHIPPHGAINVHGSLLPKYRGASPVQAALMSGDTTTGVTFMLMDAKMDHGPLLSAYPCPILETDTTPTLMARIAALAAEHLGNVIETFVQGKTNPVPQDHDAATFTTLLSRESGILQPAAQDAALMSRMVRALNPWPGVSCTITSGESFKINEAAARAENNAVGTLTFTENELLLGTMHGTLAITSLTPAGKNPMTARAFMNGHPALNGAFVK